MKRFILVFGLLILASGLGFMGGVDYQKSQAIPYSDQVDYLIQCMETARYTHQYFVDNPGHYYGQAAFTQEQWVKIYSETIEILESLK